MRSKLSCAAVLGLLLNALNALGDLDIVRGGQARATIVVPDDPTPVVAYAAQELQYHLQQAAGASLLIVKESRKPGGEGLIYVGPCQATETAGIRSQELPPNAFTIRLVGAGLFLAGNDSNGPPLGILHNNRERVGTLFAVYEFLETQMDVRWLWPGKLGEVIPKRADIIVRQCDETDVPQLVHRRWRDGGTYCAGTAGWSSQEAREKYLHDQSVWLRRQRFAMGVNMDMKHSFVEYWERFGNNHPDYFNLLPDGTRRPDPNYWGGDPTLVSMSVAEPALWAQIVEDWKATRTPENAFIDVSENDTDGKCTCEKCMAWDEPDPNLKAPFDERLGAARKAFAEGDPAWDRFLGRLSDRYARFYRAVQKEAEKADPNAVVMGLAYANYTDPPRETKLNDRIIIGIVPDLMYPWTQRKRDAFRRQWEGWSRTGARLFLRPNYSLDGHNLPLFYARKFGEDFRYAAEHGMVGTDFDSLTGQWATQGPNLYVLARMHTRPDWPVEKVLDEYYAGFGPAQDAVRAYFAHWEHVADSVSDEDYARWGCHWASFYREADRIFTSEVMRTGEAVLQEARRAAGGQKIARRRVAFLEKGLRNAELTMAAQAGYRAYRETGNIEAYRAALAGLDAYRKRVERDGVANMAYLAWAEGQTWDRELLNLMTQPGELLPAVWTFTWDPDGAGQARNWFADDFDDSQWPSIGIVGPWEQQEVGKKWRAEHGADYNGFAWYRNRFSVQPSASRPRVRLVFGAVDEACAIWVNGRLVHERPYPCRGNPDSWRDAIEVDITDVVRSDRPNVLAVRVEDNAGAGGIWKPVWLVQSAPSGGDRNAITDGGFEQRSAKWQNQTQCGTFEYSLDDTESYTGAVSARIVCTKAEPKEPHPNFTRSWGRWYQTDIPVDQGRPYRLRIWVKTSPGFSGRVAIWVTGAQAPDGSSTTAKARMLNTQGMWREVTIDNIVPVSSEVAVYLNLMDGEGTVWLDDVELAPM